MGAKPLPLKQRTSSADTRRDYNTQTWTSVLGLLKLREFVITVDHFCIWRRHLAWGYENGKELRTYMTQRYASSMVFMSLLLSTELMVLFNSAKVNTSIRQALREEDHTSIRFWAGLTVIVSAVVTLLGLISTFTAWTMVSAVSDTNAHCILRSSIGQYCAELPGRFIVAAIYSFLIWLVMFFFILLPLGFWSLFLLIFSVALFVHTITAFSALGRVIMHTGAMGQKRIFEESYEANLLPHSLHSNLLLKAKGNLTNNTSILRQYRADLNPISFQLSEDDVSDYLNNESQDYSARSTQSSVVLPKRSRERERSNSLVKFADEIYTDDQKHCFETLNKQQLGKTHISHLAEDSPPTRRALPPRSQVKKLSPDSSNTPTNAVDEWLRSSLRSSTESLTIDVPMASNGKPFHVGNNGLQSENFLSPLSHETSPSGVPDGISVPQHPINTRQTVVSSRVTSLNSSDICDGRADSFNFSSGKKMPAKEKCGGQYEYTDFSTCSDQETSSNQETLRIESPLPGEETNTETGRLLLDSRIERGKYRALDGS